MAVHIVRAVAHTVRAYLPILVSRQAEEQLLAAAQAEGRIAKMVPELLFVCVHNGGRSQMAAALAEHLSGHRVHVRSAGSATSATTSKPAYHTAAADPRLNARSTPALTPPPERDP